MKKTTQFKRLLQSAETEFVMEAHNGISARIGEQAGFKGLWGSGLAISAALGVRDNNEASWTQVLEVVEFMSDATSIPILLDADTGYGNFNNVRRLVRKLEQRGVAAVCIEDKLFPKTNSFIAGEQQPLADVEEFSNKIRAAKDTQQDEDFCVVARVEALIAGWGLGEALKRAEAYHRAGADAILIHSKLAGPEQILAFLHAWGDTCPVVIVPTTYFKTPTSVFEEAGVSLIIWANHMLRSSITAMQHTASRIYEDRSLRTVEPDIASVKEVFRLQDVDELKAAEKKYLPPTAAARTAVLLRAGASEEHDAARLRRLVELFNATGTKNIVVAGMQERDDIPGLRWAAGPDISEDAPLALLDAALCQAEGTTFIACGDILFKKHVLLHLDSEPGDVVIVVDAEPDGSRAPSPFDLPVRCSEPNTAGYCEDPVTLREVFPRAAHGEWIGLMKLSPAGRALVRESIEELAAIAPPARPRLQDLFEHLLRRAPVGVVYTRGHWTRMDREPASFPASA